MRQKSLLLIAALAASGLSASAHGQLRPLTWREAFEPMPNPSPGLPLPARAEGAFVLLDHVQVDGGALGSDETRGISIGPDGFVYVAGYVTVAGHGRDIWLAKYDADLVLQDSATVNGAANGDDEGYTMAFDGAGSLYLIGYMTEPGEGHNIWLGKFNADLDLEDDITVKGSENGDDDGYGILFDEVSGNLYVAGTVRETGEGANIWLAIYDTDLIQVNEFKLNGPVNDTDKARFMAFDDTRHLFVSGSMTEVLEREYDIWIGKFEDDLTFVDDLVVPGPTTEEDKGYGIVFSGSGTFFVTGTMIEPGESYNIWMAEIDGSLNLLHDLTVNGPVNGEDVAYMMAADGAGNLYHTGVCTEAEGGSNIWLARFDTGLELEAWTTEDGPAGGYDTGIGIAAGPDHDLFVSAVVSDPASGFDIWIGHYLIGLVFADTFESGGSLQWSTTVP
jgi:hypothetical protein